MIQQPYVNTHSDCVTEKHYSVILNEGITMCLKINKYYTNVRQHNLFILKYGYMIRLDVSHLQAPTITLPDALSTFGSP